MGTLSDDLRPYVDQDVIDYTIRCVANGCCQNCGAPPGHGLRRLACGHMQCTGLCQDRWGDQCTACWLGT